NRFVSPVPPTESARVVGKVAPGESRDVSGVSPSSQPPRYPRGLAHSNSQPMWDPAMNSDCAKLCSRFAVMASVNLNGRRKFEIAATCGQLPLSHPQVLRRDSMYQLP